MDEQPKTHSWRTWIIAIVAIPVIAVLGFSIFLANEAGRLPWQEDPTRIPITPFANLPTPPGGDDQQPALGTPEARLYVFK
jgi:hypothetical protein